MNSVYVILNEVKNLLVSCEILRLLMLSQNDNQIIEST